MVGAGDRLRFHALTQGYLIGELVRRVTGGTVGQLFAGELAGPLGADFHIGLDRTHDHRVSRVVPPPPISDGVQPGSLAERTLGNPELDASVSWTESWRRSEIPAANGHGNARSVATVQAALACAGEVGGQRLFSPAVADLVLREQSNGTDLVLGVPLRLGMGYGLVSPDAPISPNPRACYWGGWGGSVVVVDLDARMTVAYIMNKMHTGLVGDLRGFNILQAAHAAAG